MKMKLVATTLHALLVAGLVLTGCTKKPTPTDLTLDQETYARAIGTLARADTVYADFAATQGDSLAVPSLVGWFAEQSNVRRARICQDGWAVAVDFNNGLAARYHAEDLEAVAAPFASVRRAPAVLDTHILSSRAYIFAPYSLQNQGFLAARLMRDTLEHFGYEIHYLEGEQVTIDSLREGLAWEPGVFAIFTHGSPVPEYSDSTAFWSAQDASGPLPDEYFPLVESHQVIVGRSASVGTRFCVTARFIATNARFREPGIAYIQACRIASEPSMATAFFDAGARVFLSYRERVQHNRGLEVVRNLFNMLADTSTVRQAYANLTNNYSLVCTTRTHAEYIIGPNLTCSRHNTRDHIGAEGHYSTIAVGGVPTPALTLSGTVTAEGVSPLEALNLVVVRTPGDHTVGSGEAMLIWMTYPKTRDYIAAAGFQGVSGHVNLTSCGPPDSLAGGSYSGTLGWWSDPVARPPTDYPPDSTITIDGRFKVIVSD